MQLVSSNPDIARDQQDGEYNAEASVEEHDDSKVDVFKRPVQDTAGSIQPGQAKCKHYASESFLSCKLLLFNNLRLCTSRYVRDVTLFFKFAQGETNYTGEANGHAEILDLVDLFPVDGQAEN